MTAVEAWDAAVDEANRTYCKRMHNLCCDNCHSHVCRALQTMQYAVRISTTGHAPGSATWPFRTEAPVPRGTPPPNPFFKQLTHVMHACACVCVRVGQGVGHYNMVMLATGCFFVGRPVSVARTLYTFLPFVLIVGFWWLARH